MSSFRKLADNLGRLAQVPSRIVAPVVERINAELDKQFAQGSNPYGDPWAELEASTVKRKRGDTRILLRTDKMRASTTAKATGGAGIELRTEVYGGFHQSGTKHMVAREVLPARGDLPVAWQAAIGEEYAKAFSGAQG